MLNNNISTDIKLSKAQILKLLQYEGFLVSLLSKIAGLLMTVTVPLVKNILAPLGIKAAASAIDAGIQKKKNTWFWDNNFNNCKQRNELHNEWRF